jgi:3-methylcrotonyl-CoA carboxylase alpha subunit
VEHPVTEFITGIDLVEWQLRIAQGEPLPQRQADIVRRGFAVEARLYAEDPAHDYLPSVGDISHLRWPDAAPGLRLDTGVQAGDVVSSYYDPMLGKIIAWGETRAGAAALLRSALGELEIVGVATNRAQLLSVLADEQFRQGAVGTDFLTSGRSRLRFDEPPADAIDMALAAVWYATKNTAEDALWEDSRGWRLGARAATTVRFGTHIAVVEESDGNAYAVRVGDAVKHAGAAEFFIQVLERAKQSLRAECNGRIERLSLFEENATLNLFRDGRHTVLQLASTDDALQVAVATELGTLLTPLPGTIVAVHVSSGQRVAKGAPLITVEAMKMEHTLTAPYEGVVARIAFAVAERVQAGAVLVELTPLDK